MKAEPGWAKFLEHSPKGRGLLLLAAIGAWIIHHQFVFLGFYNNDDINYARLAHQAMNSELPLFSADNHFALRWTPVYFTALCYKIFGITEISSAAFGLMSLLLTGLLVHRLTIKKPLLEYVTALLLFFANYSVLFYTHRLLPDSGVCLFLFLAWYCYHQYNYVPRQTKRHWPLLFALAIIGAALTKETIILALPVACFLIWCDRKSQEGRRFWISSISVLVISTGAYLLSSQLMTGDWLYRYHLLNKMQYVNNCSYDLLPALETVRRVTYRLWRAFLFNGDMIFLATATVGYIYRNSIAATAGERRLFHVFAIFLLSANFMSISATAYVPLCEDPRHFLFLMPFAALAGAMMLRAYFGNPRAYVLLPVVYLVLTTLMFASDAGQMKYVYAGFTAVMVSHWFLWKRVSGSLTAVIFTGTLAAILALPAGYDVVTGRQAYYFEHKSFVRNAFPGLVSKGLVLTGDDITAELSEYFLDFRPGEIRFQNLQRWNDVVTAPPYLLVTDGPGRYQYQRFAQEAAKFDGKALRKIYQHGTLILYQVLNKDSLAPLKKVAIY